MCAAYSCRLSDSDDGLAQRASSLLGGKRGLENPGRATTDSSQGTMSDSISVRWPRRNRSESAWCETDDLDARSVSFVRRGTS